MFTARVRSTREDKVFSLFVHGRGEGVPPDYWSQALSEAGDTPSSITGPVQSPVPGPARGRGGGGTLARIGIPSSRQDQDRGTRGVPLFWPCPGHPSSPSRRASDATPRAVSLLRSRRRTFLFKNKNEFILFFIHTICMELATYRADVLIKTLISFYFKLPGSQWMTREVNAQCTLNFSETVTVPSGQVSPIEKRD